ncbi:terpene cyclase/mutase family protein [soil metagenome]
MKLQHPLLHLLTCGATTALLGTSTLSAAENLSLKLEVAHAIDRGNAWLKANQDSESGTWDDPKYPASTALPVVAAMADPNRDPTAPTPPHIEKAYDFLFSSTKDDGGIYGEGLATYNTAVSVMALLLSGDPRAEKAILDARRFLAGQQADFDTPGETDSPFDGGVGYGGTYTHSDLSNTHLALEALYYSQNIAEERGDQEKPGTGLDWEAAITFVSRTQNLTATNDLAWASDDPANKGGFVYFPGDSKAGEMETADGTTALRSYGSMSYAGLLSFIYAQIDRSDPRVQAVMEWLQHNYSTDENPGMEAQGLYYYYHTMAKALALTGLTEVTLGDGTKVDWRQDLALKLIDRQRADGSWVNRESGRWWENQPALVTAYAVLSLEHIHRAL